MAEAEKLRERLLAGERRALASAITLIESTRPDHREAARALVAPLHGERRAAIRLGLSGAPGAGKSTFIEGFGALVTGAGLRLAVLAVDPSSSRSGGSILGDKTRMERLSRDPRAFIRPSPSRGAMGGVARRTREAILVCEAAGYDMIVVETMGVGQSETMVADMTDVFALLVAPGGGDELQGVKRGVMEIADLVIVNKADGDLAGAAARAAADYSGALRLMRPRPEDPEGFPAVLTVSALEGRGLDDALARIRALDAGRRESGAHASRRRAQAVGWMRFEIDEGLKDAFAAHPEVAAALPATRAEVEAGETAPEAAAARLLARFCGRAGEGGA